MGAAAVRIGSAELPNGDKGVMLIASKGLCPLGLGTDARRRIVSVRTALVYLAGSIWKGAGESQKVPVTRGRSAGIPAAGGVLTVVATACA